MSEMIDRVARALCYAMPHVPEAEKDRVWADALHRESLRITARAAIEAMRKPTEEMVDVGGLELSGFWDSDDSPYSAASNVWHAMVERALQPLTANTASESQTPGPGSISPAR